MMMGHFTDFIDDLKEPTRSLSQAIPDVWTGFAQVHQAGVADGALSAKVKELMALAIAVVKQCDGCIAYHAKAPPAQRGKTWRKRSVSRC
jgi:AhpD family alkylhydroperoxidase